MGIRKKKNLKGKETKPTTKLGQQVQRYRRLILEGTLLAIDPSSGSEGSMPGYALFKAGKLVENGTLRLPLGAELHVRLQALRKLIGDFDTPDVLVVEWIAPHIHKSLHKSIGVAVASTDCHALVEVASQHWHKLVPKGYKKTDANDAVMIGIATIFEACKQLQVEPPDYEDILSALCS